MRGGEPKPISRLLKDVFSRRRISGGSAQLIAVRDGFRAVASPRWKDRVRVAALRGGTVTVETDTAGLAYELHGFEGQRLLEQLKKQPGADFVTKLVFRAGVTLHGGG